MKLSKRSTQFMLWVIILTGIILRFTNLNWDSFLASHPDERNISWAVTRIHFFDQLNPQFFAYGGLTIYLYRVLAELATYLSHNFLWTNDWGHIAALGRVVSATISSLSIFLIYLVGRGYFSPTVGLVSSFFLTFSPWAIQQAHYSTTETMLIFFLLVLLIQAKHYLDTKSKRQIFTMGATLGLAWATKTTAFSFSIIPLLAIALSYKVFKLKKFVRPLVYFIFIASLTSFLASPYTIFDFPHFAESMKYESQVATGKNQVVYTLQFRNTLPYVYQLTTMVWQSGIIATLGVVGLVLLLIKLIKKKTKLLIIFLIFPIVYAAIVGNWYTKFSRYNDPFLLFATIAAAWFVVYSLKWLQSQKAFFFIGLSVYLFIGLFQLWWGLANWTVYLRPQTRIEASRWIYKHIPKGALIFTEHWNDGLPVDLPDGVNSLYNRELLTVYEPDNPEKLLYYIDKLTHGEYIVLSTKRTWYTMPYLGDKYPLTSKFYKQLLLGNLGYDEVAKFSSYPSLGLTINDDAAEETIQVFDHPVVRIFKKVRMITPDKLTELLTN